MRLSAANERHTGGVARRGRTSSLTRFLVLIVAALALVAGGFPGSIAQADTVTLTAASSPGATAGVAQQAPAPASDETVRTLHEGQIIRLYRAVLDRNPDRGGFEFWVRRLRTGSTIDEVAAGFVSSREFGLVYGEPDDGEFVDLLYRNVLDREPDAEGRAFWIGQIDAGLTRVRIVVLFAESSEFVSLSGTGLPVLSPFEATIANVTAEELGSSWRAGCPVGPEQLRRVEVSIVNFDGVADVGSVIVHEDVAEQIVWVFEHLYAARYPVERMVPVDQYASDDLLSMEANNTSAFNCRAVTGGSGWSNHAFGKALDINPVQNPYVTSSQLLPPQGADFVDRSAYHPAMIYRGDVVETAFATIGWRWGGDFNSIKDWHHFDTK